MPTATDSPSTASDASAPPHPTGRRSTRRWLVRLLQIAPYIITPLAVLTVAWATRPELFNALGSSPTATPTTAPTPPPPLELASLPKYTSDVHEDAIERALHMHTDFPERPRLKVVKYQVQEGDTLFAIAEKFGLKPESVLWGNWVQLDQDPHTLRPGQELEIPPVDGVLYSLNEGENLYTVADAFHANVEDIIDWPGNHLNPDVDPAHPDLEPGTLLVIPGGRRDPPSWQMVTITRSNPASASILGPGFCGSVYSGPIGSGSFAWPTSSRWISGYHYIPGIHEAIDIGGSIGNGIFASDDGVVVYAGWNNYGYGLVLVIDHGNGWQTLYAHLNQINVGCGQAVFKGNIIGTMGVTGNSSGPHLHFEMRSDVWGRVNPSNFLP